MLLLKIKIINFTFTDYVYFLLQKNICQLANHRPTHASETVNLQQKSYGKSKECPDPKLENPLRCFTKDNL